MCLFVGQKISFHSLVAAEDAKETMSSHAYDCVIRISWDNTRLWQCGYGSSGTKTGYKRTSQCRLCESTFFKLLLQLFGVNFAV